MRNSAIQLLIFMLSLALALPGCSQDRKVESGAYSVMLNQLLDHSVPELSVKDAQELRSRATFLDAREPAEYAVSHIAGALPVGYDHFDLSALPDIPMNDTLIVYCSVGYRSEKVAEKLTAAGYRNVYNLVGGIFEWKNTGGEVVAEDGQPTQRIHAYDPVWGIWLKKGEKVYK